MHDKRAQAGDINEFNFFADETYVCIRSLLLAHAAAIKIYCVEQGEKINPRSMTTDVVEWLFGDVRQMTCGSTNKVTARSMGCAGKKTG